MAILWADNFQTYGSDETKLLDGIYAEVYGSIGSDVALVADPDPNASGNVLRIDEEQDSTAPFEGAGLRCPVPGSAKATVGCSARFWLSHLPIGDGEVPRLFELTTTDGTRQLTLWARSDGRLSITRGYQSASSGAQGAVLATSTLPVVTAQAWTHVEFKSTINNSTGTTQVRVNGVEVAGLTLSATDTQQASSATTTSIAFGYHFFPDDLGKFLYVKDFIIWDTTGSENNDFLGSCHVYTLPLDADTAFNWTASTGSTGYTLVDELTPDDADYIYASDALPAASEFSFTDLPPDITSVKALLTVARMRKTDGGDGQVQMALISAGDTDAGADRTITTAFTYWWDVSELSPDTAAAWTPAEVNAATVTIDRTV